MCILHDDWRGKIKHISEVTTCQDCKNKEPTHEERFYQEVAERKI